MRYKSNGSEIIVQDDDIVGKIVALFAIDNFGSETSVKKLNHLSTVTEKHLTEEMKNFCRALSEKELEDLIMGEQTEIASLVAQCEGLNEALDEIFMECVAT